MPSSKNSRPIKAARSTSPRPPPPLATKRRAGIVRVSTACEECKRRKTRCSGAPVPCQLCKALGTQCILDYTLDMRRKAALQRAINEARMLQDALATMAGLLRDGPSELLDALVRYIQDGASNDQLLLAIQSLSLDNASETADSDQTGRPKTEWPESQSEPSLGSTHCLRAWSGASSWEETDSTHTDPHDERRVHGSSSAPQLLGAGPAYHVDERRVAPPSADPVPPPRSWPPSRTRSHQQSGVPMGPSLNRGDGSNWHPSLQIRSSFHEAVPPTPLVVVNVGRPEFACDMHKSPTSTQTAITVRTAQLHLTGEARPPHAPPMVYQAIARYLEPTSSAHPPTAATAASGELCVVQEGTDTRLRIPRHLVPPLIVPDDSYLSRTYEHYVRGARQMLESGRSVAEVLGPSDKMVVDLFFRARRPSDKFDCASWACEISRSYETDVYVKLGCCFLLTMMMRWLLVPTVENYRKIPDMMKPTPAQLMMPHTGAIETIPLPPVRDAAIRQLRDWLTPLIKSEWTVNWPHGMDAAVQRDPASGATVLTAGFMSHVSEYHNWSVGDQFFDAFPELYGHVRVHKSGQAGTKIGLNHANMTGVLWRDRIGGAAGPQRLDR